jgi:hypothetical protein
MLRRTMMCALMGAATMMAGAALARPGGGPGGGGGHGMGAIHANAYGRAAAPHATSMGRVRSQGAYHASASGIRHSNSRSVLRGTTVVGGRLGGLTKGMSVVDVNGNTVGTVRGINTASGGRVVNVLVRSSTGARTIPLSPSTLSVSGGVATTTSLRRHSR